LSFSVLENSLYVYQPFSFSSTNFLLCILIVFPFSFCANLLF
jgi:hypothetical protein